MEEKHSFKKTSLTSHDVAEFIKIRFFCRISSICLSFIVATFCNDLFWDVSFILVYFISRSITDFFLKKEKFLMLNYKIMQSDQSIFNKHIESSSQTGFTAHGDINRNFNDPRNPASPNYIFKNH